MKCLFYFEYILLFLAHVCCGFFQNYVLWTDLFIVFYLVFLSAFITLLCLMKKYHSYEYKRTLKSMTFFFIFCSINILILVLLFIAANNYVKLIVDHPYHYGLQKTECNCENQEIRGKKFDLFVFNLLNELKIS